MASSERTIMKSQFCEIKASCSDGCINILSFLIYLKLISPALTDDKIFLVDATQNIGTGSRSAQDLSNMVTKTV